MSDAWATALMHARRRWQTADAAGRAAITGELDALWAELHPPTVGPEHGSVRALLRYHE